MPRAPGDPRPPQRPCLDAFTGEDLTGLGVGMKISMRSGEVTERRLVKQLKPIYLPAFSCFK